MDLTGLTNEHHIYLVTIGRKTHKPHRVELWFAIADSKIYLSHEGRYTDWMRNIQKNDRVEFTIGDTSGTGRARIVPSGETFDVGKHALYHKYYGPASRAIIDDWFSESTVIEISVTKLAS